MQLDMHYYGTYMMARTAGIKKDAAEIIATAAQFVDDNANKDSIEFWDGGRLDAEATAHHAIDAKNLDKEDQRKIWVPFHFLPGNEGNTLTEKLVCQKNSLVAQEMVKYNLSLADQVYALPLIGITAHVYADTFAHYGFSGVSSRLNKIDDLKEENARPEIKDHIKGKEEKFKENYHQESGLFPNIKSWFAEEFSGALGHGAALTYPDRPYLEWSFEYERTKGKKVFRDNPATFLEGCEALYNMFREFAEKRPGDAEAHVEFGDIKNKVAEILKLQATKTGRIQAWCDAAKNGNLLASGPEEIPIYDQDQWHNQRENMARKKDSSIVTGFSVYEFYQAAAVYRAYVLRVLLPSKGLVVT